MSRRDHSIYELSFSDELRLLSVRIMNRDRIVKGSGFLYVIHNHDMAYVLTAAHVVNTIQADEVVLVECQSDKHDEKNQEEYKYLFEVMRGDVAVDSEYENVLDPTVTEDEKRKFDAAVIPLKLDSSKHSWMQSRREAVFLSKETELRGQRVTGFGYPKYKQLEGYGIDSACVEVDSQEARCSQYTATKNILTWKLELDETDYTDRDEVGGWSGSVLVLNREDVIVLAGIVLERYPDGKGKEILGADMYHIRLLLEKELTNSNCCDTTVREFCGLVKTASGGNCGGMVSNGAETTFCISEAHVDFIKKMGDIAQEGQPIILYGPAGCGKTELARTIVEEKALDKRPYTIRFCLSESACEDDMQTSILASDAFAGGSFVEKNQKARNDEFEMRMKTLSAIDESGKKIRNPRWIILDGFYHPQKSFADLQKNENFRRLKESGNYLICTTRYNPDRGGRNYRVPPLYNTWKAHRCALRRRMRELTEVPICKRQFKKCYTLTGGNLLLADWTRKTLVWVDMKDILKLLKTGECSTDFPPIEDERNQSESPLKNLICDLYDIDSLGDDKNVLALLQFVGRGCWSAAYFRELMQDDQKNRVVSLWRNGWCMIRNQKISVDPALKLTCRVRKLTPDQQELKELLRKMHEAYKDPKSKEHHLAIRAYYKAARKAVPKLFDEEMLKWHSEICGV